MLRIEPNIVADKELPYRLYQLIGGAASHYFTRPVAMGRGIMLTGYKKQDNRYYHLRDSIEYRASCALYHLNILRIIIESYQLKVKQHKLGDDRTIDDLLTDLGNETRYLFDDIIFHCVSIYDYLASFIAFPYFGEKAFKMNWNKVVYRCREGFVNKEKSPDINNKLFSYVVYNSHDTFIDKLQNYRGQLYHQKMDFIPRSISGGIFSDTYSDVKIGIPKLFLEIFESEFSCIDTKPLSLLDVATWVYNMTLTIAIEISNIFYLQIVRSETPEPFHKKVRRMLLVRYSITVDELIKAKQKIKVSKPVRKIMRKVISDYLQEKSI